MSSTRFRHFLLASILTPLASFSYFANADDPTPEEKAYEYRDGVFHAIGWKFGKMIEAKGTKDQAAFKKQAQDMAFLAGLIVEGFELKNSLPEGTRAKKDIWEDWDDFKDRANTFQDNIDKLAASADMAAFDPKKFGSENCGNCHRKYREKE